MNTQNFPPLRSSPLMFREFQKVQENRRKKISSLTKPRIHKLRGIDVWVCRDTGGRPYSRGFGLTPAGAYRAWKQKQ